MVVLLSFCYEQGRRGIYYFVRGWRNAEVQLFINKAIYIWMDAFFERKSANGPAGKGTNLQCILR